MELTINVSDYMSDDEIKNMVRDEIKSNIMHRTDNDIERVLSNMSYYMAEQFIDSLLTEEQKNKIRNKTEEVINKLSEFTVFYRGSTYEKQSTGYTIMEKACKDFEPEIRNKVKEIIDKKAGREIIKKIAFDDRLMDGIIDKIADILTEYGNHTI
ncbi:MAG: hypothetical protein M0R51_18295 [Clostridia bacterium]|jgi:GR25 family glycosyltransferase involved in LPS biosynthesis|nr:hypothetical protein [Clostridia bacterium]